MLLQGRMRTWPPVTNLTRPRRHRGYLNAKITVVKVSIRLLAIDIDGTLLNPQFQISDTDMAALRRAHAEGVEVILVTGRRHTFALPIAQQLGDRKGESMAASS